MNARGPVPWTRFDDALFAGCALFPALLGASGATSSAPASHDEAVVRVVGLGWTGFFRGLDAIVAAPLMLVPIGTRALRAGLASALVTGACGAVAFVVARRLACSVKPPGASQRLVSAAAAVAALTAVLSPLWQVEAAAPGGTVVGALIVLSALALGTKNSAKSATALPDAGARPATDDDALRGVALVLGLAASYEPLVLAAAVAALAPRFWGKFQARAVMRRGLIDAAPAFLMGLMPFGFAAALARRIPEIAVSAAKPLASSMGEYTGLPVTAGPFAMAEIGPLMLVAAAASVFLIAVVPSARRGLASLLGVVGVGLVALVLRAPAGPTHAASAVLAATCAVHVVGAVALGHAVVAISKTRVPFAEASAALVVVLELVLPVRAADETFVRREATAANASMVWSEVAWGAAPPASLLLVSEPATLRRIAASRATGQMRDDLVVVPTFAMPSRAAVRALKAEPKLAPLYRDLALGIEPEELSLTTLATQRPLLASFESHWDRGLARHFLPVGLTMRFESEPRGASDRRKALDVFTASRERLMRVVVAKRDPDLAVATASLLRARAIGMAACGDRDVLSRALDDLRPFAPDDPVANTLVRRMVTSKGPIDVHDLVP